MARKKEPPAKPSTNWTGGLRRWLFQGVALTLLVAGLLAGIIWLGQMTREQIRSHDRYITAFADIDCPAPSGMTRNDFLDEVRYLASFPAQFGVLDEGLSEKLASAFGRHPWVTKVEGIDLEPPRRVQVRLVFRRPVLAIQTKDGLVAVDSQGIRLPKNAATQGLAVYPGTAPPPRGPAGTRWGDAHVEDYARQIGQTKD
jgi:hypothetical protein